VHHVERGQNLVNIARKHGVNWRLIALLNGIDRPELLRAGQDLKILKDKPELRVWKGDFRLALFMNGAFIKEYPIGIGENDKTPVGTFHVDEREVRPPWNPPGGGVIRHGEKDYALGERWLGFDDQPGASGLGIHGTNERDSIGAWKSNGCIRMLNEDIVELYAFVRTGTKVVIVE